MKVGNILITTSGQSEAEKTASFQQGVEKGEAKIQPILEENNKKLADMQAFITDEIKKFHSENNEETVVDRLNKNLTNVGNPYAFLYTYPKDDTSKDKVNLKKVDLEILRFWASELPNAPQAREYLVNAMFSRDYKLVLNAGKKEDLKLKAKIERFIAKANPNNTSLIDVLKTVVDNSLVGGDGYIEKVKNKKNDRLAAVYPIDPMNVICIKDEDAAKRGVLKVIKYAKVENVNASSNKNKGVKVEELPKEAFLQLDEIIHWKNRDNGDAYGHSDLEQSQETSKLIINILNQNSKRFSNEIIHSLWIDLGPNAQWADANTFLAMYKANYLGKNNFGKPLVTYGAIKVVRFDSPDKDFDYMGFMEKFAKAHAPSLFGVALSEIDNSGATYNNAEQGHVTTILHEVYPLQSRVEMLMNFTILPEFEGLYPDKNNEDKDLAPTYRFELGRENLFTMYDRIVGLVQALLSGAMTINQFRSLLDSKNLSQIEEEFANEYFIKLGNSISVISQEFFPGTDDEADDSTKNKKLINGQEAFARVESLMSKK